MHDCGMLDLRVIAPSPLRCELCYACKPKDYHFHRDGDESL